MDAIGWSDKREIEYHFANIINWKLKRWATIGYFLGETVQFHGKWLRLAVNQKNDDVAWNLHVVRRIFEDCVMDRSCNIVHIFVIQSTYINTARWGKVNVITLDEILYLSLCKEKKIYQNVNKILCILDGKLEILSWLWFRAFVRGI